MAFEIDPEAVADAMGEELEHFDLPDYTHLSDVVFEHPENTARVIEDPDLRTTYNDALTDLQHLVEEYRFESLLALMVVRDYVIKRDRGEAPAGSSMDAELDALGVPAVVMAVLGDTPGGLRVQRSCFTTLTSGSQGSGSFPGGLQRS